MPFIKRSYYGFFCTVLFLILITFKIWVGLPVLTFAIFGVGYLGLADTLYVRFRLKEKSNLDYVTFAVGALIILWTLAEVLFPH
jgi:hypothetical protein